MLRWYPIVVSVAMLLIVGVCGSVLAQTEEEMVAAYQGFMDALNVHDLDLFLSSWVDDPVFDAVPLPAPLDGKEAIAGYIGGVLQGFPDFHMSSPRILTTGNILVSEPIYTGTHQAEFMGVPATGKSVQVPGLEILEFEGDKIARETQYWDVMGLMIQIGAMPAGELPPLEPSFELPDPEPTGLTPVEAAREIVEVWNTHDLTPWAKMFHPDGDFFYNVLGIPMNRDQLVALQELFFLAFSDVQGEFVRMVDLGDGWVVAETVFQGTHDGPYLGIPATGRSFPLRVALLVRFDEDSLATHFHVYFDNLTMLVNMGVVEPPGPTSVRPSTWGQVKSLFQE